MWTPTQRRGSHRSARHRQAIADAEALPVIRRGLRRYDSLRKIAAALEALIAGMDRQGQALETLIERTA